MIYYTRVIPLQYHPMCRSLGFGFCFSSLSCSSVTMCRLNLSLDAPSTIFIWVWFVKDMTGDCGFLPLEFILNRNNFISPVPIYHTIYSMNIDNNQLWQLYTVRTDWFDAEIRPACFGPFYPDRDPIGKPSMIHWQTSYDSSYTEVKQT